MTVGDWAAIVTTAIAVLGAFTALVRFVVRRAVADNNLGHRIDEHEQADIAAIAAVNERLEQGGKAMRETDNKIERLDAKVDVLLDHFVGGSPESRKRS